MKYFFNLNIFLYLNSKTKNIQRNLNLLIPCDNNINKEGENQDRFIINPNAKSSHEL